MRNRNYVHIAEDENEEEYSPGLLAKLPEGERLLWQGSPSWQSFAIRVFHARKIAIYFAILMIWAFASSRADGASNGGALLYAANLLPLALAGIGIVVALAYAYARMTIYSITTRRVIIRSGVAMPVTVNVPFKHIDGANLKMHADGTGDIPLKLLKNDRISIMAIWPNMRPWKINNPEPMLRSVPDASGVADILAAALVGARIPTMRSDETAPSTETKNSGTHGAGTTTSMLRAAH